MRNIIVTIDAGHGGKDSGAVNGSRYEKDDNLILAKRVGKVLSANGIIVKYTRTTDKYHSPLQKVKIAIRHNADYFISIHRNSSVLKSAKGVEILLYSRRDNKLKIANSILKYFVKYGFDNRGIKVRKNLVILRKTPMPALLLEVGFISNKGDNKLFDEKLYKIADCIAKGFMDAVGLKFHSLATIQKSTKSSLASEDKYDQRR